MVFCPPSYSSPCHISPSLTPQTIIALSITSPSLVPPSISTPNISLQHQLTQILSSLQQQMKESFENVINSTLTEIVKYYKCNKMPIRFNYTTNGKTGLLVSIPVSKNKNLFNKYVKYSLEIEQILHHVQKLSFWSCVLVEWLPKIIFWWSISGLGLGLHGIEINLW